MSETRRPRLSRFLAGVKHAFALAGPHGELAAEDRRLLDRLAEAVVRRRMAMPALLFLRSVGPLSGIGSQAMVFLRPFLTPLLNPAEYDRMTAVLERREGLAALIEAVEAAQEEADRVGRRSRGGGGAIGRRDTETQRREEEREKR